MKSRQGDVIIEKYYLPKYVHVSVYNMRPIELQRKLFLVINPVHIPLLHTLQEKNIIGI